MLNRYVVSAILAVQVLCAFFFVGDILATLLGIPIGPVDWRIIELIEIGAAVGLLLGVISGAVLLTRFRARASRAEDALRLASGAFMEVMEARFGDWGLTPAERDVALFAVKGMSTQEIAELRDTSEGTVKAQTNAIYRKAGVSGRPQLLSLFIDELLIR